MTDMSLCFHKYLNLPDMMQLSWGIGLSPEENNVHANYYRCMLACRCTDIVITSMSPDSIDTSIFLIGHNLADIWFQLCKKIVGMHLCMLVCGDDTNKWHVPQIPNTSLTNPTKIGQAINITDTDKSLIHNKLDGVLNHNFWLLQKAIGGPSFPFGDLGPLLEGHQPF